MTNTALKSLKTRRTQYALGKNVSLANTEIEAIIKEAVRLSPSAFNSQSSRAVILFGAESDKFWGIVGDCLRAIVPAEAFASTEARLAGFAAGVGTVLFFEDQDVVKGLQEAYALYADAFPGFSEHSTGMAQISVWTALAEAGLGASLQHYNPVINEAVAKAFNIPASWALKAQMPFGSNEAPLGEKQIREDEGRFLTFGA